MMTLLKKQRNLLLYIFAAILFLFVVFMGGVLYEFRQFIPLIPILPQIVGMDRQKNYLILFQNNEELRPGGGFIGSYALISFDKGKVGDITVHNTYDADGLLKKHIEPYFIGRRYIQVHLYLRDSNFDVDFLKNAQKAAYMLQQETGQHVDGVIAIDVSFVKSLIDVIAPVSVWQYHETIDANNFFLVTETHSDKHSFFGSTQKQDFLHALLSAVLIKFDTHRFSYSLRIIPKILDGVKQKHLLFALMDPRLQTALTQSRLSSALYDPRKNEKGSVNDFLGINEANIGINKANYFLKRSISQNTTIQRDGSIAEVLKITYTNTTKYQKWPSGNYRAYVRIIVPLHTALTGITIDNVSQKIVPAVTDYRRYESVDFHPPDGLEVDRAEEEGKTIYGFIVSVGLVSTKTVTISYQLPDFMKIHTPSATYDLYIFKQPGMDHDPFAFSLTYPKTYMAQTYGSMKDIHIGSGRITSLTTLSTDQDLGVDFIDLLQGAKK